MHMRRNAGIIPLAAELFLEVYAAFENEEKPSVKQYEGYFALLCE